MGEIQNKKESKSLIWIVITLYLSMTIVSAVIVFIASFVIAKILLMIINNMQYPDLIEIGTIIIFLISLMARIIGLKVSVNYIDKKTIIQKIDIVKISFWLAVMVLIVPFTTRLISKKFSLLDLLFFISATVVYFAAKYFLSKKAVNSDSITNVPTNI